MLSLIFRLYFLILLTLLSVKFYFVDSINFLLLKMSPVSIELTPNRLLLDSNFNGYKLSLKEIPIKRKGLQKPVDRILLSANQYSVLHAKLFGLYNHLIGDWFIENDSVYFIDNERNIYKIYLKPLVDELTEPFKVWQVPKRRERQPGDCNISMRFVSPNLAVVGDGAGVMYIVETGNRNNDIPFIICFSDEVLGSEEPFIITDAVFKVNEQSRELHVVVLGIKQEAPREQYLSVLHWITLLNTSEGWVQVALRQLKSAEYVQYVALERNCEAIYVVSGDECKFTLNSDTPVIAKTDSVVKKLYEWSQNIEELHIKIPLPINPIKELIYVSVDPTTIIIKYDEDELIKGDLCQRIDSGMTTWVLQGNILEVTISKHETGLMWSEFISGDESGEQIIDSCIVQEVHERLTHLCSENESLPQTGTTFNSQQVEECDFETDKCIFFARLSGTTNKATHKINLGSHQVLLTVNLDYDLPPALGIRHDVDICVWQPRENFSITHEGTLLALGYVQASKQNRKFSVCPPDMSYSAICESTRHIFIYRQRKPVDSGELRHRATGRRIQHVAEQQVISIPDEEILGIYPTNTVLFLLLEKQVMALKL